MLNNCCGTYNYAPSSCGCGCNNGCGGEFGFGLINCVIEFIITLVVLQSVCGLFCNFGGSCA